MALTAYEVEDRNSLAAYLSSHMTSDYRDLHEDGGISQHTTYIKSYILESHNVHQTLRSPELLEYFTRVQECADPTLYVLVTRDDDTFFLDTADSRFVLLHSVANVSITDRIVSQLSASEDGPFDRAWFPSELLLSQRMGPLRGFKFAHVRALLGTSQPEITPATQAAPRWLTQAHQHVIATIPEKSPDAVPFEEWEHYASEPQLPLGARSKLSITNSVTSDHDLEQLLASDIFSGRKALEWIDFITRLPADDLDPSPYAVNLAAYANGKLVGNGNSVSLYLLLTSSIRKNYQSSIENIEGSLSFDWIETDGRFRRKGTPIYFQFPDHMITDLPAFVSSLFDSQKPFRLFGIPHSASETRIDVEALDLHTMDSLSLEITRDWMRIYLPERSCGNVIARLLTNLQHSAHSDIRAVAADSGDMILMGPPIDAE